MTHDIMDDKMFYSFNDPAWHTLGHVSKVEQTAEQASQEIGGLYPVEVRPYTMMFNGVMEEAGYRLIRGPYQYDPMEVKFSEVTERYKPVQPIDVVREFDNSVGKPVETLGFLGKGEQMFLSWKMPEFEIVKAQYKMFGVVRFGFDGKNGGSLFTSIYKPVCKNTVTLSQGWAERNTDGKGTGMVYSGKHVNQNMLRDMGYWMKFVIGQSEKEAGLVQNLFANLAAHPIKKDAEVHELLLNAYPPAQKLTDFYPPELRGDREMKIQEDDDKHRQYRDNIASLFFGRGVDITPDYLGVMNATSEFFCHYLPSKKPVANSVMFGDRKEEINKMVSVLKDRV